MDGDKPPEGSMRGKDGGESVNMREAEGEGSADSETAEPHSASKYR